MMATCFCLSASTITRQILVLVIIGGFIGLSFPMRYALGNHSSTWGIPGKQDWDGGVEGYNR